ncbi:helix-turn-helix domain-containing protein [Agromyces archimandritae]|uniref:Helix-turn-helix transcriptional regulator n=1 Tax=Agromyces archimandritae TaxID=2781962 RepID=A0A975FJW1_9MICO|nr:helix-turn-helix transcriptional regulator [Agromyces archimandritae]QTX03855.1 helix-turn-helix transcriptional regulator [Agromyces archimandritae]
MGKVIEFTAASRAPRRLWRHLVGEVLRAERHGQERIITEVAAAAGVSPQYLSEVERGLKEPSSEILESVAAALGLTLLDLARRVADRLSAPARGGLVRELGSSIRPGERAGEWMPVAAPPAAAPRSETLLAA